jgi:hypothetical protein
MTALPEDVIAYLVAQDKAGAFGMNNAAGARDLLAKHAPELGIGPHISISATRNKDVLPGDKAST